MYGVCVKGVGKCVGVWRKWEMWGEASGCGGR